MKKTLLSILGAATLFLGAGCTTNVGDLNKPGVSPLVDIGLGVAYTRPIKGVRHIPQSMRTVYQNDGTAVPILKDSLDVKAIWDFDFAKLGMRARLGNGFYVDVFDKLAYSTTSGDKARNSNLYEFTSSSSTIPRCEDENTSASCSDYKTYDYCTCDVRPGLSHIPTIEAGIPISKDGKDMQHLIIGLARKNYNLVLTTGQHSSGEDNAYKRYNLADVSETREYIGWKFSNVDGGSLNLNINVGLIQAKLDEKKKGSGIAIDRNKNSPFGELSLSYSF